MDTRKAKIENKSTLTDSDYGTQDTWGNVDDASAIYSIYKRAPCNNVLVTGGVNQYTSAAVYSPVDYDKLSLSLNYGDATDYAPIAFYGQSHPVSGGSQQTPPAAPANVTPAPAPAAVVSPAPVAPAAPAVTPSTATSMSRSFRAAAPAQSSSFYAPNNQQFSTWRVPY
jgi:hypothetical protein